MVLWDVGGAHKNGSKDNENMKRLLLAGVLSLIGAAPSFAQVTSINAVGYVNTTIPTGFSMVSNPLATSGGNDTIASVLSTNVPDGTTVWAWNGTTFVSQTFDGLDGAWLPASPAVPFNPGQGVFIRNSSGAPFAVTFVGEVQQGGASNPLVVSMPAGFSIVSSKVPQTGGITSVLQFPAIDGATVYRYVNNGAGGGSYVSSTYDGLDQAWLPTQPTLSVGEAFWIRLPGAANWSRAFTIQ